MRRYRDDRRTHGGVWPLRPRFEHDACGVGFIADLSGRGSHDVVASALKCSATWNTAAPRAATPGTGDGAGILTQIPDAFLRARLRFPAAAGRLLRGRPGLHLAERSGGSQAAIERLADAESLGCSAGATSRTTPTPVAAARAVLPELAQLFVAGANGESGLELERMAFCLRKRAEHEGRRVLSQPVVADHRVQGHAVGAAARAVLPRPVRRRYVRAGPGALPVLHQHVPVLAAGPPLPVRRAQRRDQHRPGQPQLDAGPRGDAGQQPTGPRRTGSERLLPDRCDRPAATRPASTRCLELLHMGGRSLPHVDADDDP